MFYKCFVLSLHIAQHSPFLEQKKEAAPKRGPSSGRKRPIWAYKTIALQDITYMLHRKKQGPKPNFSKNYVKIYGEVFFAVQQSAEA